MKVFCKACDCRKKFTKREEVDCDSNQCPIKYDMHNHELHFSDYKLTPEPVIISDITSPYNEPKVWTQGEWEKWAQTNWPGNDY